jgi:hypothetical protein
MKVFHLLNSRIRSFKHTIFTNCIKIMSVRCKLAVQTSGATSRQVPSLSEGKLVNVVRFMGLPYRCLSTKMGKNSVSLLVEALYG